MASFEEFHATQNRERAKKHPSSDNTSINDTTDVQLTSTRFGWRSHIVGKSLETYQVQFAVSVLIYLDVIISLTVLSMDDRYVETNGNIEETVYRGESILSRLMLSFQSFTLFCFILEIGALFYAFRFSMLSHCGYCLDIVIVSIIAHEEMYNIHNFPSRLLGLLRIWRVARITTTSLDQVQASHDETKSVLQNAEGCIEQLRAKSEQLKESCRAEIDLRKQVEKMLEGFKDEVDTLKEALQIAALDVAGEAEDDFHAYGNDKGKERIDTKYVDDEGDQYYDGTNEETHSSRKVIVHANGTFDLD